MKASFEMMDGNQAATHVAYKTNEVIAIYPITPASPMGEYADQWSFEGKKNLWDTVPKIIEMQSEGGAAGAVHGSLQTGALTTTFTASQGLLLMIPNMYKIAGELTSTVFHIAARSLAVQGLSIFCDHGDVMAARQTGWAMLFASNVQEAMDFSLISQASTLECRVPFLHIFDGFRTSHEIAKIEVLSDETIRSFIREDLVRAHRLRGLAPERPFIRGTAQNPDVYFQARETVNPFYQNTPRVVESTMQKFAEATGRRYGLFDYSGSSEAERVIVVMGSGAETVAETAKYLVERGEKVGVVNVRLFRPFSVAHFIAALPKSVKSIAVLDRTKEPGALGEPLYQDVTTAVYQACMCDGENAFLAGRKIPTIIGGRYGLSSKEFTPAMAKAIFDELKNSKPKNNFTIGIVDDVTHSSLECDPSFSIEAPAVTRAVFWGLGSDGTVGANKSTITIIGEGTPLYAQGYFVYDSRKAGARTISHLRFGANPIRSPYLIHKANFVAVHQFGFLNRYDTLEMAEHGATFLLNSPFGPEEVWDKLPAAVQWHIISKQLVFYVIDASRVAQECGLGLRINTPMQACFFELSGVLPRSEAIGKIKHFIEKTYSKRGEAIVRSNFDAVERAIKHLHKVAVPTAKQGVDEGDLCLHAYSGAPEFFKQVTAPMIAGRGDSLPVSALPVDGTYPSGTTKWEKRQLAQEVPVWEPDICIQCGKCVLVCPHAVIRAKVYDESLLANAPNNFKSSKPRWRELGESASMYTLQVSVEDCTGCSLCVEVCPVKDKSRVGFRAINMASEAPLSQQEKENWEFFQNLPQLDAGSDNKDLKFQTVKDIQLLEPLFEFSSACAGCGETPYLKLLSQLFGNRLLVANATGCSSIYGGNLPTTPWTVNRHGRGPAWSNSLFEDNAEFGLGMRLSIDKQAEYAREVLKALAEEIGENLVEAILSARQDSAIEIEEQSRRVEQLKCKLQSSKSPRAMDLLSLADVLTRKSVWLVGGDGWAYDIGYGGLDHVLASGADVKVLVLDTEVYSNTGGQASKATPIAAVAKYTAGGKATPKKDLGLHAMSYGYVYVARIAMGADDKQCVRAFLEAESYRGPSLIIAYSHCIAHGIDMSKGMEQQKLATQSGYWPLYRYSPDRAKREGKNPFELDSKAPSIPLSEYIYRENRYRLLARAKPDVAKRLLDEAQECVNEHWKVYERLASDVQV